MHLVVDAAVARQGSAAIVLEHLIRAWDDAFPGDQISVLFGPQGPTFALPAGAHAEVLSQPRGPAGGLWLRSVSVRRAAGRLGADAVLAGVPASGLLGSRAPRGVILYDLRFELRPEQFSRRTRVARRVSWLWSMRLSDGIFTISDRTLHDLRDLHPSLHGRARTAALGSDHVSSWPRPATVSNEATYALAFGHYGNKNAHAVIDGWAQFCAGNMSMDTSPRERWQLRLVGMGARDRAAAEEQVRRLGLEDRVELMPWLDDAAFAACFAGAGLVVFPSDFEGFGLPAAEAIRLGIPVVISTDPALAEVTGGHAVTARSTTPQDLAAAIELALARTPAQLEAGRDFAQAFTWRRTAEVIRSGLTPEAG